MTTAERTARNLIKGMSTEKLIEQWEATTENNDMEISTVRGWLMDEIENRYPEAFDEWLDSDCYDEELKNYIFA